MFIVYYGVIIFFQGTRLDSKNLNFSENLMMPTQMINFIVSASIDISSTKIIYV